MDIEKVNYTLERAIIALQDGELDALSEAMAVGVSSYDVPGPTKKGMPRKRRAPSDKPKRVRNPKNPPPPVTVEFLRVILSNRIISYDRKESAKEAKHGTVNIYRMGHLLGAMQKADKATKSIGGKSDVASLEKYRAAVKRHFTPGFAPINKFEKALDNYLKTGKRPKFVK